MKKKLFLLGLLSFFYVNSQVVRLIDLPAPTAGITTALAAIFSAESKASPAAAPTNDECEGAIPLTVNMDGSCENVTSATLFEATDSQIEAEAGTADDDVWFSFVATSPVHKITLLNVEDEVDMVTEVMEGTCEALVLYDFVDDPNVLTVEDLTVGETYYVRVYSYTDTPQEATFDICIGLPPAPPANDECENAVVLTVNPDKSCEAVTSATLEEATDSGLEAEVGFANDDVWFSFTATSVSHKIELKNIESSNWSGGDLVIEIMEGECGNVILESSDPETFIALGLIPETVYYVRVFSYSEDPTDATFDICIGTPPPAPANDECENAIALTVNTDYLCGVVTAATIESATDSGLETEVGNPDDDVWFSFTATSETHKIQLTNIVSSNWNGGDFVIEIMEGECGSSILASSDPETFIISDLIPETVYYVRIYSYGGDLQDTTFDICVGTPPDAPANDECANAVALTVSPETTCAVSTPGTLQSATDSGLESEVGDADDDVWYSFVASSVSVLITLEDLEGDNLNLVFELFEGDCDGQISMSAINSDSGIVNELIIGATYYVRVFTFGDNTNSNTTFNICVATPGPAPANDECDAAIELTVNENVTCTATTAGTIAFATDSNIPTTVGTADDDVWYTFTATAPTHRIALLNIEGNYTDMVIQVFDGDCGAAVLATSDPESIILDDLEIEGVYYVRIYTYGAALANTTFDICLSTFPTEQVNDECDAAIVLPVNTNGLCEQFVTASLANATDSGVEAEEGTPDDDLWFSFTATGTSLKVTTTTQEFVGLVTEVFEGTCDGLTLISNESGIFLDDLTIGAVYYVRVFSYSDEPVFTIFDLCVTQRQDPPANDDCAGAIVLNVDEAYCNGTTNNGNNLGATPSEDDLGDCFNTANTDIWFSFTVPANVATIDISTDFAGGTVADTVLGLYSGSCGNFTEVECDDDGGELLNLSLIENVEVTVGETYFIRVTGYNADDEGTFCLQISTNETLSTDDFAKNNLKVYPNPVKNILNLSNTTNITDVAIFNILGQQVMAKTVNATTGQIDMSNLSSGAYLVKVTADDAVQTIKIIKE